MLLCQAMNYKPKLCLPPNLLLCWQGKAKIKPSQDGSKCWCMCVCVYCLSAYVIRWPIHNFRRLFPPLKCSGYSPSFVHKLSKNPFISPHIITCSPSSWCRARYEYIHINTKQCICLRSNVHLFAFSQSMLEHASTAVPEIILANSTACERKLPKKSFDFRDLRARKRDRIIWWKVMVNLREAVVFSS